jgi:ADP-ribose pyrophosphatase YjhB (NUDIX family)
MVTARTAARGVVLTPEQRVLLLDVDLGWTGRVWMVPGGGIEPGETLVETTARELHEETGLRGARVGRELWTRDVTIHYEGRHIELHEHYFLVEAAQFEASSAGLEAYERDWFRGFRWWKAAELAASAQRFEPSELGSLLQALLANGPPGAPIEIAAVTHGSASAGSAQG